ncbi:MAG: CinA family protein [Bacilli bacterium]|jgi:nicotinamide-nucleotide amidase
MLNRKAILDELLKNKKTLGSVESLTGGLFSSSVVSIPGASSVFLGALVTYRADLKNKVAHVDKKLIDEFGVVSSEVAKAMAENGRKILGVDYCLSFTGNAGPLTLDNKEVGEVYIGLSYKENTIVTHLNLKGSRNEIREECVEKGWELLNKVLKDDIEAYL